MLVHEEEDERLVGLIRVVLVGPAQVGLILFFFSFYFQFLFLLFGLTLIFNSDSNDFIKNMKYILFGKLVIN